MISKLSIYRKEIKNDSLELAYVINDNDNDNKIILHEWRFGIWMECNDIDRFAK